MRIIFKESTPTRDINLIRFHNNIALIIFCLSYFLYYFYKNIEMYRKYDM
ncbi:hypothetical protein [Helicobacter sp. 16-1353]|nr:hypothetical protein [Helicobacter sp. 16-1353]